VSRGHIVNGFLTSDLSPKDYISTLQHKRDQYEGFNLILHDTTGTYYYSNISDHPLLLTAGIYGLSNALLDTPWPKVMNGKARFSKALTSINMTDDMLTLLSNRDLAHDDVLPNTGIPKDREKMLSACFITSTEYGTRGSSIFLLNDSQADFTEQEYGSMGKKLNVRHEKISLTAKNC